jgi:twitching motility protein PilT
MEHLTPDPDLDALVRQLNAMRNEGDQAPAEEEEDEAEGTPALSSPVPGGAGPARTRGALRREWTLPRAGAEGRERLTGLLRMARERGATDLLLVAGAPPSVRLDGRLVALTNSPLESAEIGRLCAAAVPPERRDQLAAQGSVDFGLGLPGLGRFRGNVHRERGRWAAAVRLFPERSPTLDALNLPTELGDLADLAHGLVLVTGPTGSGKTSTLAALLGLVLARREAHVITIEDPVEYQYAHGRCAVEQVEIGRDAPTFATALRAALRQDPDVLLVGEMRDPESISIAVTAAETGHLVLSTLHTGNAAQTISRILDAYPGEQTAAVRSQLSASLEAIVSQQLLPRVDGQGRVPVVEILRCNDAVRNLIRKGQVEQIPAQIAVSRAGGMRSFDRSLVDLVRAGLVEIEDARRRARHPNEFELLLGGR